MSTNPEGSHSAVFTPPTTAMLPLPTPASGGSHSSSSRRKRRLSSVESTSISHASSTSLFSRRTKQRIVEHNGGERCWHCGSAAPEIAHVIGKKDGSFGKSPAQGLLTFDHLGDEQNGIPLCPSCRRAFDDINNPDLIFIPTHLQYFIDFEQKDYQSRLDFLSRMKQVPPRVVPTAEMYAEYLKDGDMIAPEAKGGSYWRYTLRDFFPIAMDKSFIPGLGPFKEPGMWCGAPMAALRRAFQVIGDPTIDGIPGHQLEQLWQLRNLYARKVPGPDQLASHTSDQDTARVTASGTGGAAQAPATASATPSAISPTPQPNPTCSASNEYQNRKDDSHEPTGSKRTITCTEVRDAKVPRLIRFGRGSSTEVNIERYLTMLKP